MTLRKTISAFFVLSIMFAAAIPLLTHADSSADLTITPVVIDGKAKVREILKQTISITNTSQRKMNLYPSVNNVTPQEGQEAFQSSQGAEDQKDSLANWIELSRGVIDLSPGETKEVPFVIRVSLNALPGTYHADISFYEGSTLAEAQSRRPLAVSTVNTEVQADIKESMQLNKFITDSFFFSGDDVLFNYQLENIGNQELKPKGEIRIYDRKGREVASIPVNAEGKSFTPDQAAQLASAWSAAKGFGKFKAFLNIDYGNNQNGSLQDTVFFWIIPWQQLAAIFVISVIAIIVSALYFHRWLEHRHMQRFALATGIPGGMGAGAAAMPAPTAMLAPKPPLKPITAVMPTPPPEAAKPARKGFFARFRRAKKDVPADLPAAPAVAATVTSTDDAAPTVTPVQEPAAHIEAPVAAPKPVVQSAPTVPSSRTINLSGTQTTSATPRHEGHVINLKGSV
jgi:hypothetical protein